MRIEVNPASYRGDVLGYLSLIDAVLEDDGIWTLEKPQPGSVVGLRRNSRILSENRRFERVSVTPDR